MQPALRARVHDFHQRPRGRRVEVVHDVVPVVHVAERERRRVHEYAVLTGGADALVADALKKRHDGGVRQVSAVAFPAVVVHLDGLRHEYLPVHGLSLDDLLVRLVAAGALLAVEVLLREDQLVTHPRGTGEWRAGDDAPALGRHLSSPGGGENVLRRRLVEPDAIEVAALELPPVLVVAAKREHRAGHELDGRDVLTVLRDAFDHVLRDIFLQLGPDRLGGDLLVGLPRAHELLARERALRPSRRWIAAHRYGFMPEAGREHDDRAASRLSALVREGVDADRAVRLEPLALVVQRLEAGELRCALGLVRPAYGDG